MSTKTRRWRASAWSPLTARVFRALWIAQLVSNVGSWMQTVGAQWLLISGGRHPARDADVHRRPVGD
ncbi:MFS transporter [Streptomyces iakyrus]|uniref:MFS transporter n=1 Tax=Streptomyces iakyrus TaxID=68219 RepID=UPI0037F93C7B